MILDLSLLHYDPPSGAWYGQDPYRGLIEAGGVLFAAAISTLSVYLTQKIRSLTRILVHLKHDMGSVKHQVKNDHGTNLREDIDRNRDATALGITSINNKLDSFQIEVSKKLSDVNVEIARQASVLDRALEEHSFINDGLKDIRDDIGGLRDENRHFRKVQDGTSERVRVLEIGSSRCVRGDS